MERYYYVPARKEPLSFLLIARLIWDKGIREYAEAARMLKSKYPEVAFSLLGPYDSNPAAIKPEDVESWVEEGIVEHW